MRNAVEPLKFRLNRFGERRTLAFPVSSKPKNQAISGQKNYCYFWVTEQSIAARRRRCGFWQSLEHQLHPPDDFIELILTKLRIGLAEIRPGMNVVDHKLEIVAVDVVVEPGQD